MIGLRYASSIGFQSAGNERDAVLLPVQTKVGQRTAFMLSLIGTAKLHDLDPQAWLADVGLRRCKGSQKLIFAGSGPALLEGQVHLVEQMARAFGPLAKKGTTHLLVLQLEKGVAGDFSGDSLGSGEPLSKAVDLCLRLVPHGQ